MSDIHVDFSDEKPIDIPWPDEIREVRAGLEDLEEIDLVQLFQEISKIRLEVVKRSRKRPDGPTPLSEEKGLRFLSTAINELRQLKPQISDLREQVEESVREDYLRQLFPIIDSFDRFFNSFKAGADPKLAKWMDGIRAVYNSVLMILRNNDVKEIPARGAFNPKFQTAVATEERNDLPPDTILRTERRGFMLGKKILRTPEVIISRRAELID